MLSPLNMLYAGRSVWEAVNCLLRTYKGHSPSGGSSVNLEYGLNSAHVPSAEIKAPTINSPSPNSGAIDALPGAAAADAPRRCPDFSSAVDLLSCL